MGKKLVYFIKNAECFRLRLKPNPGLHIPSLAIPVFIPDSFLSLVFKVFGIQGQGTFTNGFASIEQFKHLLFPF